VHVNPETTGIRGDHKEIVRASQSGIRELTDEGNGRLLEGYFVLWFCLLCLCCSFHSSCSVGCRSCPPTPQLQFIPRAKVILICSVLPVFADAVLNSKINCLSRARFLRAEMEKED